jgi:hypothetical protein
MAFRESGSHSRSQDFRRLMESKTFLPRLTRLEYKLIRTSALTTKKLMKSGVQVVTYYGVLSIIRGNVGEGCTRIIEKHG